MDIRTLQQEFAVWSDRNAVDQTLEHCGLMLGEETGEVLRCIVKMAQGIRGTREEWMRELGKELADVLVTLTAVAHRAGLDLETVAEPRIRELLARDWTVDRNGHGLPK